MLIPPCLSKPFSLHFASFHIRIFKFCMFNFKERAGRSGSFWTLGIEKSYLCWHRNDASIFYINEESVKVSSLGINASLHFFERLTNPLLPYTIRLRSLNLLLFPSTNPELSGWDIAFLTGAISLFNPLQKVDMALPLYCYIKVSISSGELPMIILWKSLNTVST